MNPSHETNLTKAGEAARGHDLDRATTVALTRAPSSDLRSAFVVRGQDAWAVDSIGRFQRDFDTKMNPFNNYEYWRTSMRVAIMGASIARQAHDKLASGAGAPSNDDMEHYAEEAGAIAELWLEVTPP